MSEDALVRRRGKPRGRRAQTDPEALTPQQEAFIYEYDGHGGNGTRAYLAAYPACRSIGAAAASAARLLRIAKIKARVDALRAARWKRLQMDGDEALALVALDARADPRELFDEKDELLPARDWPDSVASSVKSIRPGPFGTTITLNDSLTARRIILEQTGKLKHPLGKAAVSLAKTLAGDFEDDDFKQRLAATGLGNDQIRVNSAIAGPGRRFTFLFTVYGMDRIADEQLETLFVANRDELRSSGLRQLLDRGVTFTYRYTDDGGKWTKDAVVRPTDCRANNP